MNAPLFPSSRPNITVRAQVRIPATMVGAGGIAIEKENGIWTVHPQWEDLILIAPGIALDPASKEIWTRDPITNVYNRMTLQGLGLALWSGTSDTSQTISAGTKNFTTQSGKDWPPGSYVMAIDLDNLGNWLVGQVNSYVGTTLQIIVPGGSFNGSGAPNNWIITKSTPLLGAVGGTAGEDAGLAYIYTNAPAADPGNGRVGFNNAVAASITAISVSHNDRSNNAILAEVNTWDDSTSGIKARVRIYDENDATKFLIGSISGAQVNNGTWSSFPISSPVGTSIPETATVRVEVLRSGNAGAAGAPGPAGADGAQGPQGLPGVDGTDGTDGADGAPGPQGPAGATGPAGLDGTGAGARYAWATTTAGDPGVGHIAGNNAAMASITQLQVNETTAAAQNIAAFIATLDDSSNLANRGTLTLIGLTDQTKFAQYFINGAGVDAGTHWTFPVTHIASAGSFALNEQLQVLFARTGDKGLDGAGSGDMLGSVNLAQAAGGVANTDASVTNLNVWSNKAVADANYTVLATDRHVQYGDPLTANRTLTLPPVASMIVGQLLTIYLHAPGAFSLTVTAGGGNLISNGVVGNVVLTKPSSMLLKSDGGSWIVIGGSFLAGGDMVGAVNLAQGAGGVQSVNAALNNLMVYNSQAIGDSDLLISGTIRHVVGVAALTAHRTWTLPPTASCPAGVRIKLTTSSSPTAFNTTIVASPGDAIVNAGGAIGNIIIPGSPAFQSVHLVASGTAWCVVGGTAYDALGLIRRTAVGDVDYVALPADRVIEFQTQLTAVRTLTLPSATAMYAGQELTVWLWSSGAFYLVIQPAGGGQIIVPGTGGVGSAILNTGMSSIKFVADPNGSWITVGGTAVYAGGTGANTPKLARKHLAVEAMGGFNDQSFTMPADAPTSWGNYTPPTVPRTITLPKASTVNQGYRLMINLGGLPAASSITITKGDAGDQIFYGGLAVASFVITGPQDAPYIELMCDGGVSWWVNLIPIELGGTGAKTAAGARTKLGLGTAAVLDAGGVAGQVPILNLNNVVDDLDLPLRLGAFANNVTDWNDANTDGWHMGSSTLNAPNGGAEWFLGYVQTHNAAWMTQTVHAFANNTLSDTMTWRRQQRNGIWDASWQRVIQVEAELSARYLALAGGQLVTGGWALTPFNAGTFTNGQTYTPWPGSHNYQYATNGSTSGQNINIAVPTADCAMDILMTNGAAVAGSVTFTGGWTAVGAAAPPTAANAKYIISIRRINGTSTYSIQTIT